MIFRKFGRHMTTHADSVVKLHAVTSKQNYVCLIVHLKMIKQMFYFHNLPFLIDVMLWFSWINYNWNSIFFSCSLHIHNLLLIEEKVVLICPKLWLFAFLVFINNQSIVLYVYAAIWKLQRKNIALSTIAVISNIPKLIFSNPVVILGGMKINQPGWKKVSETNATNWLYERDFISNLDNFF